MRCEVHSPAQFILIAAAGLWVAFMVNAFAQEAIGTTASLPSRSEPIAPISENVPPSPSFDSAPSFQSSDVREEVSSEPRRFQYGLQITVRGVYDDNINISQTNPTSDFYFTIEPVLTLGFGDIEGRQENFIRLDYAPGLFLFADHSENNAVQHAIRLRGQHPFSRLTVGLSEEIAILDGTDLRTLANVSAPGTHANIDVNSRTQFQTFNTRLNASYDLTGKTFLSTEFGSLVTHYDSSSLFSSAHFSENLFINYRYSDKLVFGVGGTGGYNFVDAPNPDQTFEQANVRATYQASGKISLTFSGGLEFRQFEDNSRDQSVSPVFDLSATYRATDGTTFNLGASHRIYNSGVLAAQNYAQTILDVTVRQRFLRRCYLSLAAGYQHSDYYSTVSGVSTNRQDDYYYFEPAADFSVTRFWTVGAYYLRRENDSTLQSFSFDNNQVGFRAALVF